MIISAGAVALPGGACAQSRDGAFNAPGVVEPAGGMLSIGTAATGVITHIAGAGEPVKAGQELVAVDCAPLAASVKSLSGQSFAAQAVADRVRHGPRQQEIAVGEANLGVARARAEEAADALHRAQGLQIGISVTQAAMQTVQRDARITQAQLEDARAKLDLLRSGSRDEDISEADARRDAAAGALEEAKARLAQCSVASPIDGVVVASHVSTGQFVSAAVPVVLLELEDDRSFVIRAALDEARYGDLCQGQHAAVTGPDIDALPATLESVASRISPEPQAGPRQAEPPQGHVAVRLKLDRNGAKLIAGESVMVRFEPCH